METDKNKKQKTAHNNDLFALIDKTYRKFADDLDDAQIQTLLRELLIVFYCYQDGLYIVDGDGITLRVNPAFETITGIPADVFLHRDVAELERSGYFDHSVASEVLKQKTQITIVQKYKNGNTALVTGTPIIDERGRLFRVVSNIRDISELSRLYNELSVKDRLIEEYTEIIKGYEIQGDEVVAASRAMRAVMKLLRRVASIDSHVLLLGESGTGKSMVARLIHRVGGSARPFVTINCAAIPANLIESELFGYVKGAFTGAVGHGKEGLIHAAGGGILFLDEIGQMPLSLQAKLLTFLESKEVTKIGAVKPDKVDVRIIAATNEDMEDMVARGAFRKDLYYRLNVISVKIPPLRERKEDILPIATNFLAELNRKNDDNKIIGTETADILIRYAWPGNVRQLQNVMEQMFFISQGNVLMPEDIPGELGAEHMDDSLFIRNMLVADEDFSLPRRIAEIEKIWITEALNQGGSIRAAAAILDIPASTLFAKLKKIT
jgi:PAS domain S-box-containing protein